ncbi:MAG: Hsp20/alpha crystallin family protein [Phycisphaerales bacterium]|nr:MAG: Hsp20/alpha crystallin family protein [Phycisphaerales bacterium]
MSLIPWRGKSRSAAIGEPVPQTSLQRFRDEIDRTFERFFRDPWGAVESGLSAFGPWGPAVDVSQTDTEVAVRAEIPGLDPKDLDITIQGNMLVLAGEKRESAEEKGKDFSYSECRYGSFRRTIELPSSIDPDKVTAEHKNGVITIRIEKSQAEQPKRINVTPSQ